MSLEPNRSLGHYRFMGSLRAAGISSPGTAFAPEWKGCPAEELGLRA